jgi:hypothetical protein
VNSRMKKRITYVPSVTESRLEERLTLSSASATPLPAPPPVYSNVLVQKFGHPLTLRQLRADYKIQVREVRAELREMVKADIKQLYANGSQPTAQQVSNYTATVDGSLDAMALRLSAQDSLLPDSSIRLVPAIQNELLGSGSTSLASRLTSLVQSPTSNQSARTLEVMATRQINQVSQQNLAQVSNFFNTTPVASLAAQAVNSAANSANSSGQTAASGAGLATASGLSSILEQFFGDQIESQVANTLGSLAETFPSVADAALFPNAITGTGTTGTGTTSTVDQNLLNAFTSQADTALGTAAFEIGSALQLFPGFMNVTSQLEQMLFNSASGSGSTTNNNSAVTANNLASELENLDFGSPAFNSAVASAFGTTYQNVLSAIAPFFGTQTQSTASTLTLPTTGLTNPFGTQFTLASFDDGFNNGFLTGTTGDGFVGFGQAPTDFNTAFSTAFNNVVADANTSTGFTTTLLGSTGTVGGVPVQSR